MENDPIVVDTLYNLFINRYLQKLGQYSIPTNIACGIHIGKIIGEFDRCALRVTNKCFNNSKLSFKIMIESLKEILLLVSEKEKIKILEEIGIDLNNDDKSISKLERNCKAYAETSNFIDIDVFNAGICKAPPGKFILLQVLNSGTVEANCGLETIMKSLNKKILPSYNTNNKLDLTSRPWFIAGGVLILLIIIFAICSIKKRISVKYNYGKYLYV
ncbi:S-S bond formation pathway protein [Eptesipox virus]|uniref:S-S bond formation pathway protein n=1 Tax=Eptesipox virus TaxID=1329402 RepID=A0A220T686_9POXV|nr:S-S bond formation pathway protein [Eptesipox virus]ASK51226.1 S-S bond formation pathway protein [Eptesipox virus]WAH70984.1 S-S bond formation pathway protein [Eptesipox virus]